MSYLRDMTKVTILESDVKHLSMYSYDLFFIIDLAYIYYMLNNEKSFQMYCILHIYYNKILNLNDADVEALHGLSFTKSKCKTVSLKESGKRVRISHGRLDNLFCGICRRQCHYECNTVF